MKLTLDKFHKSYRLFIEWRLLDELMSLDGIWLASASKRRSVLLKDFLSKKNSGIKLVCEPLIEDEISPKKSSLKETVYSITKMKMQNAILEISLGRLNELNFGK